MESLPLETVRQVSGYLDQHFDLSSFRLVCRSFAVIGAEVLFRSVVVHPSYPSLTRLLDISERPYLASSVRELVLELPPIRDLIWQPLTRELASKGISLTDEKKLPEVFQTLKHHVSQYARLQESGDFDAMVARAVKSFSGLKGVAMRENMEKDRDYWLNPSYLSLQNTRGRPYRIQLSTELHGYSGAKDHYRAFSALVDAVFHAGIELDTFSVDARIDPRMFFHNKEGLERAGAVFKSCRVLGLKMDIEDSMVEHLVKTPLFHVLLPSSKNLQSLTLQFGISCSRSAIPLSTIFGPTHVWPRLETVCFSYIDMEDKELYAFLQRHKDTLRDLSFSMCSLFAGRWDDAMKFLRNNMTLRELKLDPLFELGPGEFDYLSESELKMMEDFVLKGGEKLPPRVE